MRGGGCCFAGAGPLPVALCGPMLIENIDNSCVYGSLVSLPACGSAAIAALISAIISRGPSGGPAEAGGVKISPLYWRPPNRLSGINAARYHASRALRRQAIRSHAASTVMSSRLAWRLPSAEEARLNAGFFCPQDTPLLVARHHVPAAGACDTRERWPPGESSAGGTERTPPTTRCEVHGMFGSCVLPAARCDPRTLRVRCAEAVASAEELLGAYWARICARRKRNARAAACLTDTRVARAVN